MPAKKILLRLTFDGPFNVGAGALGGSPADKPLTRDARGLPVVPGSAFKGRLRHEVERLATLFYPNEPPCGSPVAENMCQGDGEPCPVCRLFGSPWRPGRLVFSDLTLAEPAFLAGESRAAAPPEGSLRYGVGLSRQRRVAEDQLLYTAEVFLPGTPLTLSGSIEGVLDEQELALLRAGLDGMVALGGGKTKGMGWFDLDVKVHDVAELKGESQSDTKAECLEVIVRLLSPAQIGDEGSAAYYNTTRDYIPGSVLRGSLAQQMATACEHAADEPHDGCDFGRLFASGPAPVFEHLYPTISGGHDFPFPAPLTARSCKYHPGFLHARVMADRGHGVGDILVRQVVYEEMLERGYALPALYRPLLPCLWCGGRCLRRLHPDGRPQGFRQHLAARAAHLADGDQPPARGGCRWPVVHSGSDRAAGRRRPPDNLPGTGARRREPDACPGCLAGTAQGHRAQAKQRVGSGPSQRAGAGGGWLQPAGAQGADRSL